MGSEQAKTAITFFGMSVGMYLIGRQIFKRPRERISYWEIRDSTGFILVWGEPVIEIEIQEGQQWLQMKAGIENLDNKAHAYALWVEAVYTWDHTPSDRYILQSDDVEIAAHTIGHITWMGHLRFIRDRDLFVAGILRDGSVIASMQAPLRVQLIA